MKFSALLALAPLVAAIPGSKQANSSDAAFSVISARSASPVHLLPLNAAGTYFWLGGNAHTHSPVPGVPETNQTVIANSHFLVRNAHLCIFSTFVFANSMCRTLWSPVAKLSTLITRVLCASLLLTLPTSPLAPPTVPSSTLPATLSDTGPSRARVRLASWLARLPTAPLATAVPVGALLPPLSGRSMLL